MPRGWHASNKAKYSVLFRNIPKDRIANVAHTKVVCEVRPTKDDPDQTRITIGRNTITYLGNCGTRKGSLKTVKLIINSTLSTRDARFMSMDLSNFYLMTPLDRPSTRVSNLALSHKKS